MREIMVRWSVVLSRSSTAATSALGQQAWKACRHDDGSSTTGVAR